MASEARAVITRTRAHLDAYKDALRHGVDSDQAADAGWKLHRDLVELLPIAEQLLAEHDQAAPLTAPVQLAPAPAAAAQDLAA